MGYTGHERTCHLRHCWCEASKVCTSVVTRLLLTFIPSRPSVSGLRKQWCPEIVDLIEHMWAHEHQDRPTMDEVVATLEHLVKQY